MTILAILLLAQAPANATDQQFRDLFARWSKKSAEAQERLGPGPHTLVISNGTAMTRIEYKSGALCLKARNEVRRQLQPDASNPAPVISIPAVTAVCVPR